MKYTSENYDSFEFDFLHINVILGANGSGKSTFLRELRDHFFNQLSEGKVVYIEGGRTITIRDVLQLTNNPNIANANNENKRNITLANRMNSALVSMDKKEVHLKSLHSDEVTKWIAGGKVGDCPNLKPTPLDRLFDMFNELFPQIKIIFKRDHSRFLAIKNDEKYGPSGFSDGEKQVFSILADLTELDDSNKLIIVDEPELNLHPELAERLWTLLENEFPDISFIYATHSISFALRENVDKVYVLSNDSKNITSFSGFDDLPRNEINSFLGSLPGILSTNKVVVTEGHDKSFDSIFYRWILEDHKIEIFPGGACTDVVDIVRKKGIWGKISTNISLIGAIDSDYRDDSYISTLCSEGIIILPLHEAESFLCIPRVICSISDRIGTTEHPLTEAYVIDTIFDSLKQERIAIAARKLFAASRITLGVSLERKVMSGISSKDHLLELIRNASDFEIGKARNMLDNTTLEEKFNLELDLIDTIIQSNDIDMALRLLPGKELLNKLAPKAGCRSSIELMRSLKKNFKPNEFEQTMNLQSLLINNLST